MPNITIIVPHQLASAEEHLHNLNQETIMDVLDQITNLLTDRLDRFYHEFHKRFDGYSPELFSGLIHLQKMKISSQPSTNT